MKIIFITQWFFPEPGAIRGLPLAKWLVKNGHEVKVITGFPNYPGGKIYKGYKQKFFSRENIEGVEVIRVPLYPSHDSSSIKRILNYLSFALSSSTIGFILAGKADVCYVYHPPPTVGLCGLLLKYLRRIPYVYHIADMWPESVLESGMAGGGLKKKILENFINLWCDLLYKKASVITVLSPGFKRLLVDRKVEKDKIEIVYNWAEDDLFKPVEYNKEFSTSLGLDGKFNVIYAGNLGAYQGIEYLIKAAKLVESYDDIQIVIAGTGQKEQELRQLAEKEKTNNVKFLGRFDYKEMPNINSLADVLFVHLKSLPFFKATIPSKVQVSLASGKPILIGVEGDSADLISKACAGIACTPENSHSIAEGILNLYKMNAQERKLLGKNGYNFYHQQMSLKCGALKMENIFKSVVGK